MFSGCNHCASISLLDCPKDFLFKDNTYLVFIFDPHLAIWIFFQALTLFLSLSIHSQQGGLATTESADLRGPKDVVISNGLSELSTGVMQGNSPIKGPINQVSLL